MRRLALQDAAWLVIEAPDRPMHVGAPSLFVSPPDADSDWVRNAYERVLDFTEVHAPLNRRLRHPHGRMGLFEWVETDVDLGFHVRHVALPKPGGTRELWDLVSRLHGTLLDRHHPLWELYFIEGLADGRTALFVKFHHALMDGTAAVRQLLASFSDSPDDRDLPPPWAVSRSPTGDEPGGGDPLSRLTNLAVRMRRTTGGLLGQATSSLGVARAFASQFASSLTHDTEAVPFQAPPSLLNVPLTASRRFEGRSYDFDRLKAVAGATGVTVNDVVLTVCGSALRAYLQSHGALPSRPLIALVPVDIGHDGSDEGNALSLLLANLATHVGDPAARLELVHETMASGKDRLRGMSRTARQNYGLTLAAPLVLGQLTGLATRLPPLYNVIISNLPGPRQPMFWNGARLDGVYPTAPIADGFALNITQTSYAGQMAFGLTADRDAIPDLERLSDRLEDALAELEDAAGV
jgi:diacylglycerol O-acyltransferase / wax synthase